MLLFILQFAGGLLGLFAKNSLKNKKVAGWYYQIIGTILYFFVFIIKDMVLYQVFGVGLTLLAGYGAFKFHQKINRNTRIDDAIRYGTLLFMLILLAFEIYDNPHNYLAITKMLAATFLMLGLRYLTVQDIKGWVLVITASLLLIFVYSISLLWIMAGFQVISTYISYRGYHKYKLQKKMAAAS